MSKTDTPLSRKRQTEYSNTPLNRKSSVMPMTQRATAEQRAFTLIQPNNTNGFHDMTEQNKNENNKYYDSKKIMKI